MGPCQPVDGQESVQEELDPVKQDGDLTSKQLLGQGNREAAFSYGNPTYRKGRAVEFLCQLEKESFREAEWTAAEEGRAGGQADGKVLSMWKAAAEGRGSPLLCLGKQRARAPPGRVTPQPLFLPCFSLFPLSPVTPLPTPLSHPCLHLSL